MSIRLSIVLQPPLDALFSSMADDQFEAKSGHLLGVVRELCDGSSAARAQVLNDEQLSPYVHVFVNGRPVLAAAAPTTVLHDGDELCLVDGTPIYNAAEAERAWRELVARYKAGQA